MGGRKTSTAPRYVRFTLIALLACFVCGFTAMATAAEESDSQRLEKELAEIKEKLESLESRLESSGEPLTSTPETGDLELSPVWSRESLETPAPFRGVYDKPFLGSFWRRAYVGGYTEFEYHSFEDGIQGIPEGFRMHRTNLFLFTEISDTVRFGSEVEFETEFAGTTNSSDIEVAVEMAFVDWTIFQELSLRGGALLAPLGRINVNHDGPVRELTERPLVSTYVIPTTLTEAGAGGYGTFHLGRELEIGYEAYAVNGFDVLQADGSLIGGLDPNTQTERILREGRNSVGGDVNDGVASTGRVALSAVEAFEVGGSWHVGTYDERGDNLLNIFAGDAAVVYEIFALEGEIAVADFSRDTFATTAGVPDLFWGYYVQLSAGGMPELFRKALPTIFGEDGAKLTAALRFDWIDIDGDRGEVIEPGISFRPVADTVFKFSYRFAPTSFGVRGVPGTETFDDEGFVLSISSYF